ncbi:AbrB/MazE/SpoVT family DNA-binding domain-containing protein [Candidatus Uhrbacteria bacterium]|nr:AbrB/MazE/SpoVT family DNA-binding domain-containing protein [Candidatus Uhrbacteria bacterium]
MEQTKVQKWGNSLAVRLPRTITRNLRFKEGTPVLIGQEQTTILIKHVLPRTPRAQQWRQFVIPTKKKKQCTSENVDTIVYGVSR